ncbi:glycosyltransferase family 2 protein [Actinomyces minihominis]|uniref:glycosyltransferase family 2 protein n=1 Tax=Actinomyces minihominis TaxID=2002838 RepID=UPI000C08327F|nr:glycosyltransferase [Actinomyces minihominis]
MTFSSAADSPEPTRQRDVAALVVLSLVPRDSDPVGRLDTVLSVLQQQVPPRLILIVEACEGDDDPVAEDITGSTLQELGLPQDEGKNGHGPRVVRVSAPGVKRFGEAIDLALEAVPEALECDWLWLLHDDMVAHDDALEVLVSTGEPGGNIGVVGPKQVHFGRPDLLLEIGIDATAKARRVYIVEPDEIDQGQHDRREDVLAVGTAGMLVRSTVWVESGGLDPALGPFGDGLEYGRRLWLSGYRVVVAPRAVIEHAQVSYGHDNQGRSSFGARRASQMYNWGLALPPMQLVLLMVAAPFLTLGRALARLFSPNPTLAFGEITAYFRLLRMTPALLRARRRLREVTRVPRGVLVPLEASPIQITRYRRNQRKILARGTDTEVVLGEAEVGALRQHRNRELGAFLALIALATLVSLFAWYPYASGVAGGSWGSLPSKWTVLVAQAFSGWQVSGDGLVGPSSPLLIPLSVIAAPFALLGVEPLAFGDLLVFASLPLAAAAGWLLASSFTRSTVVRLGLGALWASSGTLLFTLMQGDLAALCLYLSLPLVLTGLVRGLHAPVALVARGVEEVAAIPSHNPVAWLGLAGLTSTVVVAAQPQALLVLPFIAVVAGVQAGARRTATAPGGQLAPVSPRMKAAALIAVTVPGLVTVLPSLIAQVVRGDFSGFLTWLTGSTPGSIDFGVLAGLPAALPLAEATLTLEQAARAHQIPLVLVIGGAASGTVLALWALLTALVTTSKSSESRRQVSGWWLLGVVLILLSVAEVWAVGSSQASPLLLAGAGMAFVAAVASGYSGYALTVAQLVPTLDHARRWARGLPATLGMLASVVAVVSLLVLGPTGALAQEPKLPAAGDQLELSDPLLKVPSGVEGEVDSDEDGPGDETESKVGQFIAPASVPRIPKIAQEAQNGPRAARLLTISMSSGVVRANLLRGVGIQEADLSASPAPASSSSQSVGAARDHLLATIATLTAQPGSATAAALADHAVEIILLSATSESFDALQEIMDATPGLERIGNIEGSTLWRVRPGGQLPARARILPEGVEGEEAVAVPVTSHAVRVEAKISPDLYGTLVLAETADPGWRATLDGKPLIPVADPGTGGWRQAFELPGGGGELKVTYRAPYLYWWWAALGVTLLLLLTLSVPRKVKGRRLVAVRSYESEVREVEVPEDDSQLEKGEEGDV